MKREGNTIGKEGRRQGNTDPDRPSDLADRLERQADDEIEEQRRGSKPATDAPIEQGATGLDRVRQDPQGTKPGTALELEQTDTEADESSGSK